MAPEWPQVLLAKGASTPAQLEWLRKLLANHILDCASRGECADECPLSSVKRARRQLAGQSSRRESQCGWHRQGRLRQPGSSAPLLAQLESPATIPAAAPRLVARHRAP
jgi:hypothetical protein